MHPWLVTASRVLNVLTLGRSDEMFSSRCWRCREKRWACIVRPLIDRLFWWQPDHCRKSFEKEHQGKDHP